MTERPKFGDFGTHVREMVTFGNDGLGCKMAIRKKMVFWAKMCVIWRFCPYKRDIWLFWEGIKIRGLRRPESGRRRRGERRLRRHGRRARRVALRLLAPLARHALLVEAPQVRGARGRDLWPHVPPRVRLRVHPGGHRRGPRAASRADACTIAPPDHTGRYLNPSNT